MQVAAEQTTPSATPFYTQTQDLTYATELNTTTQVLVVDVNNDGAPDLIERQASPGRIAISLGDPKHPGQFFAPTFLSIPDTAVAAEMAAVDYDGDGLADLIVQGGLSSSVTTKYHNNPSQPGTFTADGQLSTAPAAFVVADLNGDGLPDIAFSYKISSQPGTILFNDPANPGQFSTTADSSIPSYGNAFAADLNGDGRTDLIFANGSTAEVLLADGAHPGRFLPAIAIVLPGGATLEAVADVNGDGVPDLLVSTPGELDVLPGNASLPGTFGPVVPYVFPSELAAYAPGRVRVADLNGDGYPDVVTGTAENHLVIYYGQADGTLGGATMLMTGPANPLEWQNVDLALADMDGDGLPDIVSVTGKTAAQMFAHQQTGTSLTRTAVALSYSPQPVLFGGTLLLTAQAVSTGGVPTGTVAFYSVVNGSPNVSIGTARLVDGSASLLLPNWQGGAGYVAVLQEDGEVAPSVSTELVPVGMSAGDPPELPITTFTIFPSLTRVGTPITMSAREFVSSGVPTGIIQFVDGYNPDIPYQPGTVLGSVAVDANGFASITLTLPKRSYSISAALVVSGSVVARAGFSGESVNILGWDPAVMLTGPVPANPVALQAVQFTASVRQELASRPAPTGSVSFTFSSAGASTNAGPASIGIDGTAAVSVNTLQAGTYMVSASYGGDDHYTAGVSNSVAMSVSGAGSTASTTSLAVSSAGSPDVLGDPVTLTATVVGNGSPNGTVEFLDGYKPGPPTAGTVLATVPLGSNGQAWLTTSSLSVGAHTLGAAYVSGGAVASYTASATMLQVAPPLALQLSSPLNPDGSYGAGFGDAVGLTATVALGSLSGNGSVQFVDGYNPSQPGSGTVLATIALNGNGQASFTTASLGVGLHSLGAVYVLAGSVARAAVAPTVLRISQALDVLSLTAVPASPVAGQPTQLSLSVRAKTSTAQEVPTGSVLFQAALAGAAESSLGTVPLDSTGTANLTVNTLQAGSYTVYATYLGDADYIENLIDLPNLTVMPDTTTVTVHPSAAIAVEQEPVTFQVNVGSVPAGIALAGTVTLLDGSASLASGTVDSTGTFSARLTNLATGNHAIVAQYLQTGSLAPHVSQAVPVTIVSANMQLAVSTPTLQIAGGENGTVSISLPNIQGIADTVTFSCSNLPAYAACRFMPAMVALGPNASTILTIATNVPAASAMLDRSRGWSEPFLLGTCVFPFGLLSLAGVVRSRRRSAGGQAADQARVPLLLVATLCLCGLLASCSQGPSRVTSAGTYGVQVTAKGTATALVGAATVTVVVTQ